MLRLPRSTVRLQLTLWYVGVLSAILIVFSFVVYSVHAKHLYQKLDGNLRSAAEVAALSLNHEIEEHGGRELGEPNVRLVLNTMHQTSFPRPGIAVWDGGRLVAEKPGIAGLGATALIEAGLALKISQFTTVLSNSGEAYRVAVSSVHVESTHDSYQVTANESLAPIQTELATIREIFVAAVVACLLLVSLGGYFLARKSLAPVLAMVRTAENISSHNLDRRLAAGNPSDELGQLADTFNRLFERLQRAFGQQRQFMTDASHELRTPLSVALTATQVSLKEHYSDAADLRETLEVVQAQLLRLRRVVTDMFTLAHADAGNYQPKMTSFYLEEVVQESVRAARVLANVRTVQLKTGEVETDCAYTGDEGLIRQLLLILLDNAVKYTPAGGRIAVALRSAEGGYSITVRDTGRGIPQADQPHIFDRFYRVDKSRSRLDAASGGGAGLGLAIAQWIAGLHCGAVRLRESSPAGSVFEVWLPAIRPTEPAAEEPEKDKIAAH